MFCIYNLSTKKNAYYWKRARERASPAYAMNIYGKESMRLEKSYCFDNPYAFLQIAEEAIKGLYWHKNGKRH
jgi:hypothetical protein